MSRHPHDMLYREGSNSYSSHVLLLLLTLKSVTLTKLYGIRQDCLTPNTYKPMAPSADEAPTFASLSNDLPTKTSSIYASVLHGPKDLKLVLDPHPLCTRPHTQVQILTTVLITGSTHPRATSCRRASNTDQKHGYLRLRRLLLQEIRQR